MKTTTRLLSLLALCTTLNAQAQIINMNPDPDGEPWLASLNDISITSGYCENPPVFQPTPGSLNKPLPVAVHNESYIWSPYIIHQNVCR
jgi:hypothetical protein